MKITDAAVEAVMVVGAWNPGVGSHEQWLRTVLTAALRCRSCQNDKKSRLDQDRRSE